MKKLDCSTINRFSCGDDFTIIDTETFTAAVLPADRRIEYTMKNVHLPSTIVDKLIYTAAKCTERFASDLLIDLDSLRIQIASHLNTGKPFKGTVYFGFRALGVDHENFIETRSAIEYRIEYSQIWKLEYELKENSTDIEYILTRLSDYVGDSNFVEVDA